MTCSKLSSDVQFSQNISGYPWRSPEWRYTASLKLKPKSEPELVSPAPTMIVPFSRASQGLQFLIHTPASNVGLCWGASSDEHIPSTICQSRPFALFMGEHNCTSM